MYSVQEPDWADRSNWEPVNGLVRKHAGTTLSLKLVKTWSKSG